LYIILFCFFLCWFDSFLLFVPVQVIACRTVSEMTCNVSSGTLNITHSLTHSDVTLQFNGTLFWPVCSKKWTSWTGK